MQSNFPTLLIFAGNPAVHSLTTSIRIAAEAHMFLGAGSRY
ncbi:MAG: hypothetical protein WCH99_06720 [Verrucomicrobiota bacterium]